MEIQRYNANISEISDIEAAAYLTDEEIGTLSHINQVVAAVPFMIAKITLDLQTRVQASTGRRCSLLSAAKAVATYVPSLRPETVYTYANALQFIRVMFPEVELEDPEIPFSAVLYARRLPLESVPEFFRRVKEEKDVPVSKIAKDIQLKHKHNVDEGERLEAVVRWYGEKVAESQTQAFVSKRTLLLVVNYTIKIMEVFLSSPSPYHRMLVTAIAVLRDLVDAMQNERD